jgi:hypothetical protein
MFRLHFELGGSRLIPRHLNDIGWTNKLRASVARRRARHWVEALENRALLSTITVTNTGDTGTGTLRAAIEQANLDAAQDMIDFAPSVTGTITLATAMPDVSTNMIIAGPGRTALTVARSPDPATPDFRIFIVVVGVEVSISGLTITGGRGLSGGGISNGGMLTLTDCTLSNDTAIVSSNIGGSGGGISNSGTLTLTDCTLSHNTAIGGKNIINGSGSSGGGISNSGTTTLTDCTINGNLVSGGFIDDSGGGISNSGTMILTGCTLSGNSASANIPGSGGGIKNGGTLTLIDCSLSGNSAGSFGGNGGIGGGISNSGTTTLTDCTLSDNSAGIGGGVYISQMTGNLVATVTASSSLFDNVTGGNLVLEAGAEFVSLGHNLFSDAPAAALDPTDLVNSDPLLGALADNGGPTLTLALLPGSPAIDAGAPVAGVTTDQRGVPRPQGIAPDIGAFEVRATAMIGLSGSTVAIVTGQTNTITAMVTEADGTPLVGIHVTFRVLAGPNAGATGTSNPTDGRTGPDGRVQFTYIGAGGPGTDTIAVTALLPAGVTIAAPQVMTQWVALPTVVNLQHLGVHLHPTTLVVTLSTAMDAARAESRAEYRLIGPGPGHKFGTKDDHRIRIRSARYNPTTNSVVLRPVRRLPLHDKFQLTVKGTAPDGLTSTLGILLDGAKTGQPGSNYVARITGKLLVPPIRHHATKRADVAPGKTHPARLALRKGAQTVAASALGTGCILTATL